MKYFKSALPFILIFLANLILFLISYPKYGMFFVDTSREVYIPAVMNAGEILYKDIFNVYPPLAYQINAFFTSFGNNNLNTFYILGFINSTIILWALSLIFKIFIKDNNKLLSAYILLVICSCVYSVSLTNYIFPYSYSMVYALNAFCWSLLFLLYYIQKKESHFFIIACLLFGASISFKYEFLFFGLVLIYYLTKNDLTIKSKVFSITCFILIPIISYLNLLLKGLTYENIILAVKYMQMLSNAESTKYLYKFLGFIPTLSSIKFLFINFIKTAAIITLYYFIANKIKEKKSLLIILSFITFFMLLPLFIETNAFYFNWVGILIIAILPLIILKKENQSNRLLQVLFISVILASLKSIFNIGLNSYGTYFLPIIMLCIIIYFSTNFGFKIKIIKAVIVILAALFLFSNIQRRNFAFNQIITTHKGSIGVSEYEYKAIKDSINYINSNTNEEDKILVMPEGAMINYLTDRTSDSKYYYLIPPNIEIFTENKIYNALEYNLPQYIILQPKSYNDYGKTFFCEDFGKKICPLISKYYDKPIVFGDDFWIALYKRKTK